MSRVMNSVTCGAVNALPTIAAAVELADALDRDAPLARPSCGSAPRRQAAGAAARGAAAASTSARVIVPCGPVPVSAVRSTPRSLASLRTGGLASTVTAPAAGAARRPTAAADDPGGGRGRRRRAPSAGGAAAARRRPARPGRRMAARRAGRSRRAWPCGRWRRLADQRRPPAARRAAARCRRAPRRGRRRRRPPRARRTRPGWRPRRRRRSPRRLRSGPAAGSVSKVMIDRADVDDLARRVVQLRDDAGVRGRHLDGGLGGLHLDDRLVEPDRVADRRRATAGSRPRSAPRRGRAAGTRHAAGLRRSARHQNASDRSTACRTRSRSGR